MGKSSTAPLILLDSDVIRHFINGNFLHLLDSIFPGRFVILDKVKQEICRSRSLRPIVEGFISNYGIVVMPFPEDINIIIEYAYLNREFGAGEKS